MIEPFRLSKFRIAFLLMAPLLLLCVAWGTPVAIRANRTLALPAVSPEVEADGAAVYQQNCAWCHGADGNGVGLARLTPRARYFGYDKFKFATTQKNARQENIPTDANLLQVINHGIPGSPMPGFQHLPESHKQALVNYLRTLLRKGLYDRAVQKEIDSQKEDGEENVTIPTTKLAQFASNAAAASEVGASLTIPEIPATTPQAMDQGKRHFKDFGCASCHGPDGRGDSPQVMEALNDVKVMQTRTVQKQPLESELKSRIAKLRKDAWLLDGDVLNVPRNLTLGWYKGGGRPEDIYARIALGIHGTPMPASDKPHEQLCDLVHYVKSLAK